jgi:PTS system fructose-specific IIC component
MAIKQHLFRGFKIAVVVIILYSITLALSTVWILPDAIPNAIFWCIVPVLTAAIASSMTPKITIVPGLVLGVLFTSSGLGFFGGIIGGLLLGLTTYYACSKISIDHPLWNIIVGYVLIGGLGFVVTYVVMEYLIGPPILLGIQWIRETVESIGPTNGILLVGVLSFLTVIDLGGPFNKLAYTFILSFYLDGFYHITGPIIISVALPPMIIYLALKLFPKRFDKDDQSSTKLALFGALFGMTEGALPVTIKRPVRVLPAILLGSVTASVLAAYFELENILLIPSIGGLFGTSNILFYILCHVIGVMIGLGCLFVLNKKQLLQTDTDTV